MRITIDECCGIEGEIVEVGEVVEVDDHLGRQLIAYGRAHESTKGELAAWTKAQKSTTTGDQSEQQA